MTMGPSSSTISGLKLAFMLLSSSFAQAATFVFAGSGNCDASDIECHGKPPQLAVYAQDGDKLTKTNIFSLPGGGLPSWTRTSNDGKCLFVTVTDGTEIISYSIRSNNSNNSATADLKLASKCSTGGQNPVYIDQRGGVVYVANYHGPDDGTNSTGAGVSAIMLGKDCDLTKADFSPTAGKSVNPGRQGASHIHSVVALPSSSAKNLPDVFACDLGSDKIIGFKFADQKLKEVGSYATLEGSGPRHMVVHPTMDVAYVVHEMGNYVGVFKMLPVGSGPILKEVQRITTRPGAVKEGVFSGFSKAAEIQLTKDASVLLVSNRGYGDHSGNVVGYRISQTDGTLAPGVPTSVLDKYPRGMELDTTDSSGSFLLVAGQSTSVLRRWKVNSDGSLTKTDVQVQGPPNPTTVAFATV